MTVPNQHPELLLDAWLDGRLDAAERTALEAHLAGCARCRDQLAALEETRAALRATLDDEAPPPGLEWKIRALLDVEDVRAESPAPGAPTATRWPGAGRWLPIAAALAAVTLAALLLRARPEPAPTLVRPLADPVQAAAAAHAELAATLPADLAAENAATVEERWRASGIGFPARVLDLDAMGIELAGGDATTLSGRASARTVYRTDSGWLTCWMYLGTVTELPAADELRERGGFVFHVYRRDGRTLVFWQEGEVVCALVGTGDAESVIALAFAKAMAPPART